MEFAYEQSKKEDLLGFQYYHFFCLVIPHVVVVKPPLIVHSTVSESDAQAPDQHHPRYMGAAVITINIIIILITNLLVILTITRVITILLIIVGRSRLATHDIWVQQASQPFSHYIAYYGCQDDHSDDHREGNVL